MLELKEGDPAPDFNAIETYGREILLREYLGKKSVVLYFYPKDDTPGCTKEACAFRDNVARIRELNTEVIGVSLDSAESHKAFAEKYGLNFPLIPDPDKRITELYRVPIIKRDPYGEFTKRTTFVIDKHGKISRVFRDVDVSVHADQIIDFVKQLK